MTLLAVAASLSMTQCEPRAEDFDFAVLTYAYAQEKIRHGGVNEGIATLRELAVKVPQFGYARWAVAVAEESRRNRLAAYHAYKQFLAAMADEQDKKEARRRLAELEAKDVVLQAYANAERATLSRDWTTVVRGARQVISQQPEFALAHRLLAIAYSAQERANDAASAYRQYLALAPDAPDRGPIKEFLETFDRQTDRKEAVAR